MTVYAYCLDANFDPSAQTCSTVQWTTVPPGGLPQLSVSDAQQLGWVIVFCWSVGYAWRMINRQIT